MDDVPEWNARFLNEELLEMVKREYQQLDQVEDNNEKRNKI